MELHRNIKFIQFSSDEEKICDIRCKSKIPHEFRKLYRWPILNKKSVEVTRTQITWCAHREFDSRFLLNPQHRGHSPFPDSLKSQWIKTNSEPRLNIWNSAVTNYFCYESVFHIHRYPTPNSIYSQAVEPNISCYVY